MQSIIEKGSNRLKQQSSLFQKKNDHMIYITEFSLDNSLSANRQREPMDFKISSSRNIKQHLKSRSMGAHRGHKNPLEFKKYRELWDRLSLEDDRSELIDINKRVEEMREHTHRLSSQIELIKVNQEFGKKQDI